MKIDAIKLIGIAGAVLGMAATVVTSYATGKELDAKVAEKVAEALANQTKSN